MMKSGIRYIISLCFLFFVCLLSGNQPDSLKHSYLRESESFSDKKDYDKALIFFRKYVAMNDSVLMAGNLKEETQAEMQRVFERKRTLARLEQEKKDVEAKEEQRLRTIIISSVSSIMFLGLLVLWFIIKSYRRNHKVSLDITEKKQTIEEKQREILDSIHYARRIQRSMLPTEKYLERILKK